MKRDRGHRDSYRIEHTPRRWFLSLAVRRNKVENANRSFSSGSRQSRRLGGPLERIDVIGHAWHEHQIADLNGSGRLTATARRCVNNNKDLRRKYEPDHPPARFDRYIQRQAVTDGVL